MGKLKIDEWILNSENKKLSGLHIIDAPHLLNARLSMGK
jgi:hypothetical protein